MSTEPTIFEKSRNGRVGVQMPTCDVPVVDIQDLLPGVALRTSLPLPELTEGDVMRHFLRISQKNYCVDKGFYPLGSCTMKYNPKINDVAVQMPGFARVHPFQPEETVQGTLQVLFVGSPSLQWADYIIRVMVPFPAEGLAPTLATTSQVRRMPAGRYLEVLG